MTDVTRTIRKVCHRSILVLSILGSSGMLSHPYGVVRNGEIVAVQMQGVVDVEDVINNNRRPFPLVKEKRRKKDSDDEGERMMS